MLQAVNVDKIGQKRTAVYPMDRPGQQAPLLLPTVHAQGSSSAALSHVQSLSKAPNVTNDIKQKLSSLLAAEFSRKVRSVAISLHVIPSGRSGTLSAWFHKAPACADSSMTTCEIQQDQGKPN